jgi:hypothetical protein
MNASERIVFASAGRATMGERAQSIRLPLEALLLATAVAYAVLGALTDPVWGAAVTSVFATVVTLRRMRVEVRRGNWLGAPDIERHV